MKKLLSCLAAPILVCALWCASVSAGQANVFVYHRFGDNRYPSTDIAVATFAAQLQLLKDQDYTVLPLGEIVRRLRQGESLPERCAALTVDDAFESFWTGARPLLQRYGFPVTLFVATDTVGGDSYLSWEQLRTLVAEGVEIGNHTASHPYLLDRKKAESRQAWEKRIRRQILAAQVRIKKELGITPSLFAYPYGEYDPATEKIVSGLGFAAAVGQQSGVIAPWMDMFALPRFPMGGEYATLEGFREKLHMKPLPVRVVSPDTPVVGAADPPVLVVDLGEAAKLDLRHLRCFVQGQGNADIEADREIPGRFTVRAVSPLAGRRNKYTLTAPGRDGRSWYWFSQLWVFPGR